MTKMKQIIVSGNRPCLCNSGKKYKNCCGFGIDDNQNQTNAFHFLLKDTFHKILLYIKQNHQINELLNEFKIYNKIENANDQQLEMSFVFIEFLIFRAKFKNQNHDPVYNKIITYANLTETEKQFLIELKQTSKFTIFKVNSIDKTTSQIEIENIFTNEKITIIDKNCAKTVHENGLLYTKYYNVFDRNGILPTFNFRTADSIKKDDIKKIVENFQKRLDNVNEENKNSNKPEQNFNEFIDEIEYEIYGGDNPYETFKHEEALNKFLKENPNKTIDDYLDLIEDELLGIEK